jgi:hypothetical protein
MDSERMTPDDQGMPEEWIVRVAGKEYGPASIETLREWKAEGRVLPANEARPASADLWTSAAEIPGLFIPERPAITSPSPPIQLPSQSPGFGQILTETLKIYATAFLQFLSLTLLVVLPSTGGQLAAMWTQSMQGSDADLRVVAAGAFAFLMFFVSLAMWPVYIAGIQILTVEIAAGRRIGFFALSNDAVRFWPRITTLCVFVYGVFFLLIVFALLIAAMIVAAGSSLFVIFLALALLVLQVWMFGRFFVNVLFWQQFAVLENAGVVDSLHESRHLAHSGRELPWFQRPLWRAVFIASLWFAFVLAIALISQWATLQRYFNELMTTQDPQALLQKLTESQRAHGFDVLGFVLSLLQKILQPLIGIAFVILYLNSRRER